MLGYWLLIAWLDAGVPSTTALYAGDEQRCLTVAQEHLDGVEARPDAWIELLYIGCVQGSAPRRIQR
jgi:hypothetical protein